MQDPATGLLYSLAASICTFFGGLIVFLPGVSADNTQLLSAFMGMRMSPTAWGVSGLAVLWPSLSSGE